MSLRIGFLGMSDNKATATMLDILEKSDLQIVCKVFLVPSAQNNWRRLKRKVMAEGLFRSIQRILYSVKSRIINSSRTSDGREKLHGFFVTNFSSPHCHEILEENNVDLLLLCTDQMIKRSTFSIPKIGTLNAHPGWIPKYRGLGAIHKMVEDGFMPAISVHYINEGVDTGKLVLRDHCEPDVVGTSLEAEAALNRAQALTFIKAVKLIEHDQEYWHDSFLEESSMTRGYPKQKFNDLYLDLDTVKSSLKRCDLSYQKAGFS